MKLGYCGMGCASLLLLAAFARPAHAEGSAEGSARANVLFKKGKVAFNDGRYNDALRIYSEAWHLKQSPDIAANLAQTEAELGRHRDAAEHFAFALAHLLPSTTDEQKDALADGLEVEKKDVGTLHITAEPADGVLTIDDAAITLPTSGDVYVEPGEHRCSLTHEGYEPGQQSVQVSKGAAQVLWIKLLPVGVTAEPPPPVTPPPAVSVATPSSTGVAPKFDDASARSLVPAVVGGAIVVAGAAVGVAFLLSANSDQTSADQIKDKLPNGNPCGTGTPFGSDCARLHDKNVATDHARTVEVVGFAVAGAAAVGTALYLLWPHASSASARGWAPSFSLGRGEGSLGLERHF